MSEVIHPRRRSISQDLTDVESDSRRSSGPLDKEKLEISWANEIYTPAVDFDLSGYPHYTLVKSELNRLKQEILQRTESIIVKVPESTSFELAMLVNNSWPKGCESSREFLFFEVPQSLTKSNMVYALAKELDNNKPPGSWFGMDVILQAGDCLKAPDVALWLNKPSPDQRHRPLAAHLMLPNLWVEIFNNEPKDRGKALSKIEHDVIPICGNTCAILAIGLPNDLTFTMNARLNLDAAEISPTTPATALNDHPCSAPYIGYWGLSTPFHDCQWFAFEKNRHLSIVLSNNFVLKLEFNALLPVLDARH